MTFIIEPITYIDNIRQKEILSITSVFTCGNLLRCLQNSLYMFLG